MKEIKVCFGRVIQAAWVVPTVTKNFRGGIAQFRMNHNPHYCFLMLLPVRGKRPTLEGGRVNPAAWWMREIYRSLN